MVRSRRSAFSTSVACLQRPEAWAALILLVLNDQYLKFTIPSWWTGKLSDIAGLFFFSFIATAIVGFLLQPFRIAPTRVGQISFTLLAFGFGLVKIAAAINLWVTNIWSSLVGYNVPLVQDPGDLLALVMLIPAWQIWRNELEKPAHPLQTQALPWTLWLILSFSALVSLASSCDPGVIVDKVIFEDGTFYLSAGSTYARLSFGDETWQENVVIPDTAVTRFDEPHSLPRTQCLSKQTNICYRIDGTEQVWVSEGGGENWQIAWKVPEGRREFVVRFPQRCDGAVDMGPYDLAIGEGEQGYSVVVAMGNEGVLTRSVDGSWQQQAVFDAEPTPFRTTTVRSLYEVLKRESYTLLILTAVYTGSIFYFVWRKLSLLIKPFLFSFVGQNLVIVLFNRNWDIVDFLLNMTRTLPLYVPLMLIGTYVVWQRESGRVSQPALNKAIGNTWFMAGLIVFLSGITPFVLWAAGVIIYYNLALSVAVITTILSMWLGWKRIHELLGQA